MTTVKIDLSDEQAAVLKAKAAAQGLSLEDWLRKLAETDSDISDSGKPFKSAYGLLAKYGPAPSAEEIDANRAEMFRGLQKTSK